MRGKPASLKNDKEVRVNKKKEFVGLGKPPAVRRYLQQTGAHFRQQREQQKFDAIPMPMMVGVLAELYLYTPAGSSIQLPTADNDNLWTTVQEAMQHDVVYTDDRQVRDPHPLYLPARSRVLEHIRVYVWVYEGNPYEHHIAAMQWVISDKNPLMRLDKGA